MVSGHLTQCASFAALCMYKAFMSITSSAVLHAKHLGFCKKTKSIGEKEEKTFNCPLSVPLSSVLQDSVWWRATPTSQRRGAQTMFVWPPSLQVIRWARALLQLVKVIWQLSIYFTQKIIIIIKLNGLDETMCQSNNRSSCDSASSWQSRYAGAFVFDE